MTEPWNAAAKFLAARTQPKFFENSAAQGPSCCFDLIGPLHIPPLTQEPSKAFSFGRNTFFPLDHETDASSREVPQVVLVFIGAALAFVAFVAGIVSGWSRLGVDLA